MIDESASTSGKPGAWRKNFGLLLVALLLLVGISFGLKLDPQNAVLKELDPMKVRIGLGVFACIAFLWLSEALPLAITALLVPLLACGFGLMDVKDSLTGFAD